MAHLNTSKSLVRHFAGDMALMPPPPVKRIKRPPKVLDEDDYTSTLSKIIARDYFPGLRETQAQQEYLTALEADNQAWIAEAGQRLREAITPRREKKQRSERNKKFDNLNTDTNPPGGVQRAADTPRTYDGSQTPSSIGESQPEEDAQPRTGPDTSSLSISSFQSTYTSEDNASFNTLLDNQNQKRRKKHAYMWTQDQRIPSARQIAYREQEQKVLKQKGEDEANGRALMPMSTGATETRPARPDAWNVKKPDNAFMFFASSVDDDDGLSTAQDVKETVSKARMKEVIHENTRFPLLQYDDEEDGVQVPPSPSLNTDIIARRDASRAAGTESEADMEYPGGDTPRINGYAFVDEDEPSSVPAF